MRITKGARPVGPEAGAQHRLVANSLSPAKTILLAILIGLCGGYLDLILTVLGKYWWNNDRYFRNARDFLWTVPAGHAALLLFAGLAVGAFNMRPSRRVSLRAASWLFASLSIWGALLRAPLSGAASFLLAVGLGRVIANRIAAAGLVARPLRYTAIGLFGLLGLLAVSSSGAQAIEEYRAVKGLPPSAPNAGNVILIVWDTVRAYSVSSYGSYRDTTPNLSRWAGAGVQYNRATAPAPWTYPSHCCFMTGQWPHRINAQWKYTLEGPLPTLAEFLGLRGYQTAAFAANTSCCTYESGLNRGFAHFEDYPLSPRAFLTRTVPGRWLLRQCLTLGAYLSPSLGAFYDAKWAGFQSRGARQINDDFLAWLSRRRSDRPFFAFLNYFDAHDPFVPPAGFENRFGIAPRSPQDYRFLFDYSTLMKGKERPRDVKMAFDCYHDCVAFLDEQLEELLGRLRDQGLLENTTVIITSDHGEGFGDHGFFGHAYGAWLDELGVPLVILSPGAPKGKEVNAAVSLRDLPATVVDVLGLGQGSPFPGRSLAAYWPPAGSSVLKEESTVPAFSEQADARLLEPGPPKGVGPGDFHMSLVADAQHYFRDGLGREELFDLIDDPLEKENLSARPDAQPKVMRFRRMLLEFLMRNPASVEVDNAYLRRYRAELESAAQGTRPALARSAGGSP